MARAIPFSLMLPTDVFEYVESIPGGQKTACIVAAIRASPEYQKFTVEKNK